MLRCFGKYYYSLQKIDDFQPIPCRIRITALLPHLEQMVLAHLRIRLFLSNKNAFFCHPVMASLATVYAALLAVGGIVGYLKVV